MKVVVGPDGNVEKALRKFKKKVMESKLLETLKENEFYTKPTVARKTQHSMAVKRWKRYLKTRQLAAP